MPRIQRVRVANIQYDHGKKQIPDITLDLRGENGVVLLGNGGGKTLLLQLIMQTVLPNEPISGRRIRDLLQTQKYTGHVVVEWLLDSNGSVNQYLCTGFCFSHSPSQNEGIRFFTYLFDYQETEPIQGSLPMFAEEDSDSGEDSRPLSIETLPLLVPDPISGKTQPIRFQQLKDWLRDQSQAQIQVFDQINVYQERLRIYHIFPEEWKNMRDTNGSEGGVEKFFERSKSTATLVDNLLIPSVEEVIFRNESKKRELMQAFAEYRSTLMQMPIIQQNLKDFAVIRDHADSVVNAVAELDQVQQKYEQATTTLWRLAKTFWREAKETQENEEALQLQLTEAKAEADELSWLVASYEVFKKHGIYLRLLTDQERAEQAVAEWSAKLNDARQHQIQLEALDYYNQWLAACEEISQYQTQLRVMDQAEPELQQELLAVKKRMRFAWQQEYDSLQAKIRGLEDEKETLAHKLDKLSVLQDEQTGVHEDLQGELATVRGWLEQYREKQRAIQERIPELDCLHPEETLAAVKDRQDGIIVGEDAVQQAIAQMEQERLVIEERKSDLNTTLVQKRYELDAVEKQWAAYQEQEKQLAGILASHRIFDRPILENQTTVILKVKELARQAQEERSIAQAKFVEQQEKWALISERDFYIPHHDLLTVQQHLTRLGMDVVLGSEWLQKHQLSWEEKQQILQQCPVLPFGFLVEKGQIRSIRAALRQLPGLRDFPLAFVVRNQIAAADDQAPADMISLLNSESIYLYHSESMAIYTSAQALADYKEGFSAQLDELREQLHHCQSLEEDAVGLRRNVEAFYQQYAVELVKQWEGQLQSLEQEVIDTHTELEKTTARLSELTEELRVKRQELEDLREQRLQVVRQLEPLQEFVQMHSRLERQTNRERELLREVEYVKSQLARYQEEQRHIYQQQASLDSFLKDVSRDQERHNEDWRQYQLELVDRELTEDDYATVKQQVSAIRAQLHSRQQDRSNFERLLAKVEDQKAVAENEIEERNTSFQWLASRQRTITKQEIKEARAQVITIQEEWQRQDKQRQKAEQNCKVAQARWQDAIAAIQSEYEREPYTEYTVDSHSEQYQSYVQKLARCEEQQRQVEATLSEAREWYQQTHSAYEMVSTRFPELKAKWDKITELSKEEWVAHGKHPFQAVGQVEKQRRDLGDEVTRGKVHVEGKYQAYLRLLSETNNARIRQFIRDVESILAEQRLFNYDFVQDQFLRIFEALDVYQQQYTNILQECERNFAHLVNLCWRRAVTVYDSIIEIPKNSRVQLYERDVQIIRMDWRTWEPEEQKERIEQYLRQVLIDLQNWKEQGTDDDEIDRKMEELLRTRNLVNVVAPVQDCRVTVFKPRKESMIRNQRLEYAPWDEVCRWSGGEEYSIYITMFMIILTHIRQQAQGRINSWKVLMADNPFGKASSPHILDTVFEVARANRIQLVCFTAHKEDGILRHFPVVYSLQLRNAYGREVMKAEELESGFYRALF